MEDMKCWVSMPKVELHAHLNGSVRDSTLLDLARELDEKGAIVFSEFEDVIRKDDRSIHEVFKLFALIHDVTTEHSTVTRITKEVVEDFAAENVVYLELRTTPKRNDAIGMTKGSYMEAVIKGLRSVDAVDLDFAPSNKGMKSEVNSAHLTGDNCNGVIRKKMFVRLLLSIDRREATESAMDTVKLALELRDLGVVGIDLSGKPTVGEWTTFLPALNFAREHGLHITLHCGEVSNQEEIHAMLDFLPGRVGHACLLDDKAWRKLKKSGIPVEICLTSNIRTNTISSLDSHHFADLYREKHPLSLCTDDSGVFSTSLSKEYSIAAAKFGLSQSELFLLSRNAIDFAFAEEPVIKEVRQMFNSAADELVL